MKEVIVKAKKEMEGASGQATFEWIKHKMLTAVLPCIVRNQI